MRNICVRREEHGCDGTRIARPPDELGLSVSAVPVLASPAYVPVHRGSGAAALLPATRILPYSAYHYRGARRAAANGSTYNVLPRVWSYLPTCHSLFTSSASTYSDLSY